jgi:hypothetical protein
MAITPNYGFPYPEASDPVDVAGDIEALAKAIDEDLGELLQDTVGGMVSSNTESGISVTYNDELGKLNFDVTVIPTQSGNTGKYLTTNGTAVSWGAVDALPTQSGNTGKFLSTNGTAASWADTLPSQTGNTGKYLTTNGSVASWAALSAIGVSYLDLTNVPSTFAPSTHATSHGSAGSDAITIAQSQVTNLTTALSGKASSTHTHPQSDITNLTTALAAKAPVNNPTFTGTITGTPSTGIDSPAASNVGYRGIPKVYESGFGAYTVQLADAGKFITNEGTRTITIPSDETTNFEIGTTIVFIASAFSMTIAIESPDILILVGSGATGSRTLAARGMATAIKTEVDVWMISGNGLS